MWKDMQIGRASAISVLLLLFVLVFVVLGGIGNIRGSIIAATVLTILPEVLRAFADYRMLVYAVVLILVMLATNSPLLFNLVNKLRGNKFISRILPQKKEKEPGKEGDAA